MLVPLLLPICSLDPGSFHLRRSRGNEPASALSRLFNVGAVPDESWERVTSTWDTARTFVHSASKSPVSRAEEQGDVVGSDADFEQVVGVSGGFRELQEEASGDVGSGGSGSIPAGSGDFPPSPSLPPPASPLAPGEANIVVNKTIITIKMTIAGDVSDFGDAQQAKFVAGLRANVCDGSSCPGVEIQLAIAAGSVEVTSAISYREDDSSIGTAVLAKAESLQSASIADLSAQLGVTVEAAPTVTVQKNVEVTVTAAAPSPPPTAASPPPPVTPSPSEPGSGNSDDSGGLASWAIAIITVAAVLGLLGLGLAVFKYVHKKQLTNVDYGTEMAKRGDFPLAIGASTTQHV